jgi:hypothetical protein
MGGDQSWGSVSGHDEHIPVFRMSEANMPVGVQYLVVMENVLETA